MLYQSTCVGFGYGLNAGVLSWKPSASPANPIKAGPTSSFVTHGRPRTINLVPIGYGFRPRLRGRLTLRGLALRRNPWTFGESVSHTLCRYSCQHSRFRYLQQPSRAHLHRPTERSATDPEVRRQKSGWSDDVQRATRQDDAARQHPARSPDTRRAISTMSPHRHSRDRGNSAATPASRRPMPIAITRNRRYSAADRRCLAKPSARLAQIDFDARRS